MIQKIESCPRCLNCRRCYSCTEFFSGIFASTSILHETRSSCIFFCHVRQFCRQIMQLTDIVFEIIKLQRPVFEELNSL